MANIIQRYSARVAVYLLGMRGNTVLLAKRKNTGHMDGYWALVAGHVDEGETCIQAMIREAQEECALQLQPHELKLIGAMHHCSPPHYYANFIFVADLTNHEPQNCEPHKCEALAFYNKATLPDPIVPYVAEMIKQSESQDHCWVSEFGWE